MPLWKPILLALCASQSLYENVEEDMGKSRMAPFDLVIQFAGAKSRELLLMDG